MVTQEDLFKNAKTISDINEHVISLYCLSKMTNPKIIVELGTGRGDSTTGLLLAAQECNAVLYTTDSAPNRGNIPEWLREEKNVVVLNEDGVAFGKKWGEKLVDFVFVDTSHSYEQTTKEIETWMPLLKHGGIMTFHDTVTHADGVMKAIKDYLNKHIWGHAMFYNFENNNCLGVLIKW